MDEDREPGQKLPLHDEAKARHRWRGGDPAKKDGDAGGRDGRPGEGPGALPPPD